MNYISLIGWGLALIGIVLLISNSTNFTHINYIWIMLSLIIGFVIAWIGGAVDG